MQFPRQHKVNKSLVKIFPKILSSNFMLLHYAEQNSLQLEHQNISLQK